MTDEEVIQCLAERAGWILWQEVRGKVPYQVVLKEAEPWNRVQYAYRDAERARYTRLAWNDFSRGKCLNYERLPDYLKSRDALQPILEGLTEKEWNALHIALSVRQFNQPFWGSKITKWLLTIPAHDLAHALAEVIAKGKE